MALRALVLLQVLVEKPRGRRPWMLQPCWAEDTRVLDALNGEVEKSKGFAKQCQINAL